MEGTGVHQGQGEEREKKDRGQLVLKENLVDEAKKLLQRHESRKRSSLARFIEAGSRELRHLDIFGGQHQTIVKHEMHFDTISMPICPRFHGPWELD